MNNDKRNISVYNALTNQDINSDPVVAMTPPHNIANPLESDYKSGYVRRYFVKKINNEFAYETNETGYLNVDLSIWQKIKIEWKISGQRYTNNQIEGIEPYNSNQISIASVNIPEIKKILTNPVQFARFS